MIGFFPIMLKKVKMNANNLWLKIGKKKEKKTKVLCRKANVSLSASLCHQHFNDHFTTLLSLNLDLFQLPQVNLHSELFCWFGKY